MHNISINLSEEELAKLIQDEKDPLRKEELLQLLTGDAVDTIVIETVNILGTDIGRVDYNISTVKSGVVISVQRKHLSLTHTEITQVFDLIKTFQSLNTTTNDGQSNS